MKMTDPLPIECRARYDEIFNRSNELIESFINGNRGYTVETLVAMEPKASLAVLSTMMMNSRGSFREDLNRFLKEVA